MDYEITDYSHLKKFLLGGKAEFTLKNIKSGNHYTFQLRQKDGGCYFLFVILQAKIYLGFLSSFEEKIIHISRSPNIYEDQYKYFDILKNFLDIIFEKNQLPKGIQIFYTGYCSVCNRKLKDPESLVIGIGSECRKKK